MLLPLLLVKPRTSCQYCGARAKCSACAVVQHRCRGKQTSKAARSTIVYFLSEAELRSNEYALSYSQLEMRSRLQKGSSSQGPGFQCERGSARAAFARCQLLCVVHRASDQIRSRSTLKVHRSELLCAFNAQCPSNFDRAQLGPNWRQSITKCMPIVVESLTKVIKCIDIYHVALPGQTFPSHQTVRRLITQTLF